MARKSDGSTSSRKKKTVPATTPAAEPIISQATPAVPTAEVRAPEVRSNVTPINVAPPKPAVKKPQTAPASVDTPNLDAEIRRRAYELFQERNGAPGDPAADWLIAEREVRARYANNEAALAATQGR